MPLWFPKMLMYSYAVMVILPAWPSLLEELVIWPPLVSVNVFTSSLTSPPCPCPKVALLMEAPSRILSVGRISEEGAIVNRPLLPLYSCLPRVLTSIVEKSYFFKKELFVVPESSRLDVKMSIEPPSPEPSVVATMLEFSTEIFSASISKFPPFPESKVATLIAAPFSRVKFGV